MKRHAIVKWEDLGVWAIWVCIVGAAGGFFAGYHLAMRIPVPLEALRQAREAVESDMRAACSSWFTDKRGVVDKRIVVCRSPKFLDVPNEQH